MGKPLRVGFLGAGLIAEHHARGLSATDDATIVACYDIEPERCARFAASHGAQALESVEAVVAASDAIYVCAWTAAHPDLVSVAVDAGRAVFCEKPLAVDLATVEDMTERVRQAGVVNQVGLVLRRSPAFRWVAETIRTRDVGRLMSIVFRDDQYLPIQGMYGSTWRADAAKAGAGTLIEHSIHDLDLITWMMGPVSSVAARTANFHGHPGIEDQAHVRLDGLDGVTASLISIWHDLLDRPSQRRVEVFCEGAYFHIEGDWSGPVTYDIAGEQGSLEGVALAEAATDLDGRGQNADVDFIRAVVADQPAYPDFSVALEAHRLCDAAYQSAAEQGRSTRPSAR